MKWLRLQEIKYFMLDKLGLNGYNIFDTILVNESQVVLSNSNIDSGDVRLTKDEVIELANDLLKLSGQMK